MILKIQKQIIGCEQYDRFKRQCDLITLSFKSMFLSISQSDVFVTAAKAVRADDVKGFPMFTDPSAGFYARTPYGLAEGDYVLIERFDSQEADPTFYVHCNDIRVQNHSCPSGSTVHFAPNPSDPLALASTSTKYWGQCDKGCDSCCVSDDGQSVKCLQCYQPTYFMKNSVCASRGAGAIGDTPGGDVAPKQIVSPSACMTTPGTNCAECSLTPNQCTRCNQGYHCNKTGDCTCKACGDGYYGNGAACTPCLNATTPSDYLVFKSSADVNITDRTLNPIVLIDCDGHLSVYQGTIVQFVDITKSTADEVVYLSWNASSDLTAEEFFQAQCDKNGCGSNTTTPGIQLAACNSCNPTTMCSECAPGYQWGLEIISWTHIPDSIVEPYKIPATSCTYCGAG